MWDVLEIIMLRIKLDWEPNPYEVNGDHLILDCIRDNCAWGFEALLKGGVDPNMSVVRFRHVSILSQCMAWGRDELVALALKYGADPNIRRPDADTALDYALLSDNIELVGILLKHGADPNVKNTHGETSLFTAYRCSCFSTLAFLAKHGADLKATNKKGETVLDLMIQNHGGSEWTMDLLQFPFLFSRHVKDHPEARRIWFRRRMVTLLCVAKLLSLHQRAVVTANHPLRKLSRNEFHLES